jgi:hypothetical protein
VIFSGSVQSSDDIDLDELIPEPTILYDSVELFPEGLTTLTLNQSFQKNWIYYFSFESYVPFSDVFLLDAFCQTPASRNYHFFDYNSSIENDITKIYFEYGAAESGDHLIDIEVITSQNINIHVYLEECLPLDAYYNHFTLEGMNESSLFLDVNQYSLFKIDMEYTYPVKDDTEYKFNFFRVNPLSVTDIVENAFENPEVIMRIILNETEYIIYRNIPTLDYSLYGNVENDEFLDLDRNFINTTFAERFGAHCTENLSISITIEGTIPFDLNFAFLVWEVGEIGNGTDGIGENQNMSIPNPINNKTDLHNESLTDTLDRWTTSVGLFIQSNWWTLFITVGTVLIIVVVYGKYKKFFQEKVKTFRKRAGSEVYDNQEKIPKRRLYRWDFFSIWLSPFY